ncbi:hypothetical protein EUX98_g1167 [Antrodiella citrinella]|uniref:GDS1 winged helix domain-containing protein n=1 Tax=Antrodiella citrinella TaxID=2447956 RepID=A0A4S4NAQ7_9APHY|nr:hypothetical protein EUX98_g1167 [Antrodiella citrinella]
MLHSDDMNSKVFIAVGRALMSVNNCAMTIKDLADLCMKFGLACQNPSAAGQAITTYIRTHLIRCDAQQDHPLLLRHTMSGTLSDDELVPALHSRVGGAHCMINVAENRVTNFRRGTVVWYLSKAAGAPCPFARAGITLSDYNENGKSGTELNASRERKRERDRQRRAEQCGQKRKRLSRACADNRVSGSESSEDEQRPAKFRIPRLKNFGSGSSPSPPSSHTPLIDLSDDSDSDSDGMSTSSESEEDPDQDDDEDTWSSSADPQQHVLSIPLHAPISEASASLSSPEIGSSRRSLSMPYSATSGSPPPDSEDEDEDYHISMTGIRRATSSRPRLDSDYLPEDEEEFDSDFMSARDMDMDTHWEDSPGPRSPSAQFEESPVVKSEPRDVQGLLDAWDDLDLAVTDRKVVDVVTQAAAGLNASQPKDPHSWSWQNFTDDSEHDFGYSWDHGLSPHMKEEIASTLSMDALPDFDPLPVIATPLSPYSTYSAATSPRDFVPDEPADCGHLRWDTDILSPASVPSDVGVLDNVSPILLAQQTPTSLQVGPRIHDSRADSTVQPSVTQLPSVQTAAPQDLVHSSDRVPAICATEYEGIPVYQMASGSSILLRRIDTDYVNVSVIQDTLGIDVSASTQADAAIVSQGSAAVCGVWLPLTTARRLLADEPLVHAFLSDDVGRNISSTVDELRMSAAHHRGPSQFGRLFSSTVEAKRESLSSHRLDLPLRDTSWDARKESPWEVEDHLLSIHPLFAIMSTGVPNVSALPTTDTEVETPLSPTEEEMFRTLCSVPDWEPTTDAALPVEEPLAPVPEQTEERTSQRCKEPVCDVPLRRSKRVLTAGAGPATIVTRSRTRSSKRGSRSSLS